MRLYVILDFRYRYIMVLKASTPDGSACSIKSSSPTLSFYSLDCDYYVSTISMCVKHLVKNAVDFCR